MRIIVARFCEGIRRNDISRKVIAWRMYVCMYVHLNLRRETKGKI